MGLVVCILLLVRLAHSGMAAVQVRPVLGWVRISRMCEGLNTRPLPLPLSLSHTHPLASGKLLVGVVAITSNYTNYTSTTTTQMLGCVRGLPSSR